MSGLRFYIFILAAAAAGASCSIGRPAFGQEFSSGDLIRRSAELDGRTVVYNGEVIGDIMRRGRQSWINVHDGANALGVWLDTQLVKSVLFSGSYASAGDLVSVSGVFHRSCAEHGGDMDIHASSLRVIKQGHQVSEKISMAKARFVLILAAITVLLWILSLLKIR